MGDWRADLLQAVGEVFAKENEGLLAKVHTHRVANDLTPSVAEKLEQQIEIQVCSLISIQPKKSLHL